MLAARRQPQLEERTRSARWTPSPISARSPTRSSRTSSSSSRTRRVEISYRRRILHGKIDILRAELVNRLRKKHEGGEDVISGADVQRSTDILAGRAAGDDV